MTPNLHVLSAASPRVRRLTPWIGVLLSCTVIALIPQLYFRVTMDEWFPRVLPQLASDSHFYLAQIREVLDGHPGLGNAFIRDYAGLPYPGPQIALWLGAAPGFLGLGINGVFLFNTVFYHLLAGSLFYGLFLRLTRHRKALSAFIALFGVVSLHKMLMRPTMQIVYPALLGFLWCLYSVLEKPHQAGRYLWLGLSAVFAFYLYPYLWMTEFSTLGFLFLRLLWIRDWKAVRLFCLMGIGIVAACSPQIITTVGLFSDTEASMLNFRLGMVETHRVLPLTFLNLKYLFLLVLGLGVVRTRRPLTNPELVMLFAGAGVICTAFSNVVTGKELDLETHPLWISFGLNAVAVAVFATGVLERSISLTRDRITVALLAASFFFTTSARVGRQSFNYTWRTDIQADQSLQEFDPVLSFLRDLDTKEAVIVAPNLLSLYIAIYTNHYLFFSNYSAYLLIPNDEQTERWLVQFSGLMDPAFIEGGIYDVKGGGPRRKAIYQNAYGGGNARPIDMLGGDAYIREVQEKAKVTDTAYVPLLRKYGAQYMITDTNEAINPRVPDGAVQIYKDDRFAVYDLQDIR